MDQSENWATKIETAAGCVDCAPGALGWVNKSFFGVIQFVSDYNVLPIWLVFVAKLSNEAGRHYVMFNNILDFRASPEINIIFYYNFISLNKWNKASHTEEFGSKQRLIVTILPKFIIWGDEWLCDILPFDTWHVKCDILEREIFYLNFKLVLFWRAEFGGGKMYDSNQTPNNNYRPTLGQAVGQRQGVQR